MARAGRPRKQGPRTKSGRLKQQHDAGTDELRAKKVALVGPGGDPSKSTNTIDILESWGHLTKDQSRSLHYFVKVRSLMIGKAAPRSISIEGIKGTPPEVWMSDNQALWWWYCYREMDQSAIPSHSKNHVRRIIFDDLLPKWYNHQTSLGRYQCLAQAIQPDQTSSCIEHAPTRPRNLIRETKNQWTNIGG